MAMGDSNDRMPEIWESIWASAKTIGRGTTKIALELFYVMKSPDTSVMDKIIIGAALGYQFLDEDLIDRKKHPLLGLVDNGVTLLVAYSRVQANITPEIEAHVEALLDKWFGASGEDNGGGCASVSPNVKRPPKFDWTDDDN